MRHQVLRIYLKPQTKDESVRPAFSHLPSWSKAEADPEEPDSPCAESVHGMHRRSEAVRVGADAGSPLPRDPREGLCSGVRGTRRRRGGCAGTHQRGGGRCEGASSLPSRKPGSRPQRRRSCSGGRWTSHQQVPPERPESLTGMCFLHVQCDDGASSMVWGG